MLTFEKIRELERAERDNKKLQPLPEDFMDQLRDYLRRKERINEKTAADLMEIENVKNTIRRFFESREHKIVLSVLDTVRTGIPAESLTPDEEKLYNILVDEMKKFREQFFTSLAKEKQQEENKGVLYRIKKTLPEFVGPDMKNYKLNENDVVAVPKELEELLLKEGVIEKI